MQTQVASGASYVKVSALPINCTDILVPRRRVSLSRLSLISPACSQFYKCDECRPIIRNDSDSFVLLHESLTSLDRASVFPLKFLRMLLGDRRFARVAVSSTIGNNGGRSDSLMQLPYLEKRLLSAGLAGPSRDVPISRTRSRDHTARKVFLSQARVRHKRSAWLLDCNWRIHACAHTSSQCDSRPTARRQGEIRCRRRPTERVSDRKSTW